MATSSCSELNQLTTAQESQHSHQPQDPLNLMHGGIFSHEYITYSIVIIIISIGMMMTLPKLSAMLQRFLQLKKLILDCQIPLEEIEPFIVDGQVFPPYIKELGWKFHVHTDKNHDQVHSPQDTSPFLLGERAVVIGGSIAGLLSASCLSPFFKEVVLIERSKYVEGESVVKHRHGDLPHILVNRGQSILEKLFPGIIQEVRTKSAQITLNPSSHQQYETPLERRSSNTCDQNDFKATSSTGDSMISKTQQQQFSDSSQQQHNSQKTIPSPPSPSRTTSSAKPYFVMKNFFNASEHLKLIYSSDQSQPLKRVQNGNHEVTIVSRGMWESTIRDYVFKATKNIKVYDGYQVLSNGKGIKLRVEPIRRGSSSDQQRQQQENQETQSLSSTQQLNVQVCGVIIQKVEKSNTTTGSLATTSTQHIHHHHTKGSQSNHSQDDTIELDCDLVVNCGGIHTCADYSKLLKGVEHAMIWATVDPSLGGSSTKTLSSTTIHGHEACQENKTQPQNTTIPPQQQQQQLLYSTRINNKVRYHCFYFEPKDEAFDWFEKGIPGKLLRSPVTVVHDDDEEDPQDPKANSQKTKPYYAFYHLLTYPQTKGVLCIPMERNMFMINLITIADEEKENNRRISEGLTLENAKERIIEYYAKGAPFEKDLISVLNCMKDQPIRIPPPYEKEGNMFVHYEELLHYENPMNHHETFLSGFIAMGDSVSSMNPVYAQGMTTCLESTLILRESIKELLAQQLKKTVSRCTNKHTPKREELAQSVPTTKGSSVFDHEFCSKFQQAIYYMLFIPWLMTSSDDIRYCDTEIPDRKHAPSSSRQQPSRHDNSHINHSKTYSRSCRWQKYMVAPLLDFMLYHIFSSGSTTEIVANYFYTILNMQDGFR
ncbi:hypothetical protein C9374_012336 [Naegleria lovaniensis]|uniref:FAD/NAD(P)-binding domain-containing protein n=1 Tax=Naegleria lovaniensis TaxID=51637 RepID=A0AA88KCF4_NAELO|nr:uncharacterized protein C9374_012336 [Naegleria lovaniensis]KAG2373233.1 hypothetical protein C9374_012336 [Naegleria lovaniensis]